MEDTGIHSGQAASVPSGDDATEAAGFWRPIDTAPRDGSWVILEGEFCGGDTSSARVGRWEPRTFPDLTPEPYEWRVFDPQGSVFDRDIRLDEMFNWYCEGRVFHWAPLDAILSGEA